MQFYIRFVFLFIFICVFTWSGNRSVLIGNDFPVTETITSKDYYKLAQIFADRKVERIDSILERYHKHHDFHGTVHVSTHGETIYKNAFGTGDFRTDQRLTTDTPFQLASVSKQFTAMAALMLEEAGELSFDDKVTDYFPSFPYEEVDVQMLLNHTAGLPNYMWIIEHKWNKKRVPYNDDVIDLMAEQDLPLYFWPGTRFNYSNTNYAVLAAVIEKAAGKRFHQFVAEEIFDPLGMDDSYVYSRALDSASHGRKLPGFRRYWNGFRMIAENMHDGVVGDKGVYSTVEDLHKWDQALYNNELISQQQKEKAFTKGKVKNGLAIPYGYGFRLKQKNGKKIVYHNGRWNGFRTSFIRHVEDTTTIILLNHTNSSLRNTLVSKLERVMDQPSHYEETRELVKTVMREDVDAALNQYRTWQQKPASVSVSEEKIREAAELMKDRNKPRAAARIDRLYIKLSNTESSETANPEKQPSSDITS